MIAAIYNEALLHGECYDNLHVLCKQVGNRIAGSENAAKAIEWGVLTCMKYDFDSVFQMPVEVPHWVRGPKEIGFYNSYDQRIDFNIVALGGSVGSKEMITAEVIEIKSLAALDTIPEDQIKGKIVFFNKAMDPLLINTGAAYGGAYDIRSQGPSKAASKGAVACIIRSLTLADDQYAHTGATQYDDSLPKIPAAALSSVDARALSYALKDNPHLKFSIHLQCEVFPRIMQANVVAEIRGSEFPDQYIIVGGHLDSWDIGEGAHDDGTGVTQAIEVLRIMRALGYQPKHTIRAVLYMNEEFGNDGGKTYAEVVKANGEKHIAAVESDGGGLTPQGFF
ncbi:MAG: M20/M25/M40 family metallo-hydrolase [Flavobacteriales bacterium]